MPIAEAEKPKSVNSIQLATLNQDVGSISFAGIREIQTVTTIEEFENDP